MKGANNQQKHKTSRLNCSWFGSARSATLPSLPGCAWHCSSPKKQKGLLFCLAEDDLPPFIQYHPLTCHSLRFCHRDFEINLNHTIPIQPAWIQVRIHIFLAESPHLWCSSPTIWEVHQPILQSSPTHFCRLEIILHGFSTALFHPEWSVSTSSAEPSDHPCPKISEAPTKSKSDSCQFFLSQAAITAVKWKTLTSNLSW